MMNPIDRELVRHFRIEGAFLDAAPYGFGYIHDTYIARFKQSDGGVRRVIIQRINHDIFKKPAQVMENIHRVTNHIRSKITDAGGDAARGTLTIVPARDGDAFWVSPQGHYWRAYRFIDGARAYLQAESPEQYYQAGKAFGRFLKMLDDFDPAGVHETIPDFHHTPKRFRAFLEALERDAVNRAVTVSAEIDFALQRAGETGILVELVEAGAMPERVTHNDTKFDNVMLDDETGDVVCVIDLDTVMPGLAVFDFGDAVRAGANPAAEDERDLAKVRLDLTVYDRLARGFIEEVGDLLTPAESDHLAFGAKLITYEQGIRFLTDYLNGDIYYKTQRPDHNLDRCRTQFKLVSDMEREFDKMVRIVERYRLGAL